ncbi:MAG TPA: hypothetical protein ENJ68_06565 [Devosia sp.]|nr:hypothetical protein [Devosia sp.]
MHYYRSRSWRTILLALLCWCAGIGVAQLPAIASAQERGSIPGDPSGDGVIRIFADQPLNVKSATGFLHGQNAQFPPLEDVAALAPRLIRGTAGLKRAAALDAVYHLGFGFAWGYPADNWRGRGPPYAHLAQFQEMVRRTVREIVATGLGDRVVYNIWNEPGAKIFWQGGEQAFFTTAVAAIRAIREVQPDARIAAPTWNSYDLDLLKRFADFAMRSGVRVDVLNWHHLVGPGTAQDPGRDIDQLRRDLLEARRVFIEGARYAALGVQEIHIDEYVGRRDQYRPGPLVAYLRALEEGGADRAAHACWPAEDGSSNCFNKSLDGLIDPRTGGKRPKWWLYRQYGRWVADRVRSTSPDPHVAVLAARRQNRVQILVGHLWRVGDRDAAPPRRLTFKVTGLSVGAPGNVQSVSVRVSAFPAQGEKVLVEPQLRAMFDVDVIDQALVFSLDGPDRFAALEIIVEPK